jgi:uncharacterized protein DUF2510/uncharacterized protein DUF732
MTSLNQAGWYDDPTDPTAQRYWDGTNWTPHRQRRPIPQAAPSHPQAPPPLRPMAPPPPGDFTKATHLPPPNQTRGGGLPDSAPPGRSRRRKIVPAIAAMVVVVAAVAVSLTVYRYFVARPSMPAEQQFAHDVAAAGVMSADPAVRAGMNLPPGAESTARIVAVATAVCADLNSGSSKDAEAMQLYQGALAGTLTGGAPLPHDKAVKIVDLAVQDVCPGK